MRRVVLDAIISNRMCVEANTPLGTFASNTEFVDRIAYICTSLGFYWDICRLAIAQRPAAIHHPQQCLAWLHHCTRACTFCACLDVVRLVKPCNINGTPTRGPGIMKQIRDLGLILFCKGVLGIVRVGMVV